MEVPGVPFQDCVVVGQRTVESIIDLLVPSASVPAVEIPTIVSLVVLVPQMDEGPVDVRKDVSRVSSGLEQTVDIRVPGGSCKDRVQQRTVESSCAVNGGRLVTSPKISGHSRGKRTAKKTVDIPAREGDSSTSSTIFAGSAGAAGDHV